jgi:hypothetical protein
MKVVPPIDDTQLVYDATQRITEALKETDHKVAIMALAGVSGSFVGAHSDTAEALDNFMRNFGKFAEAAAETFGTGGFKMQMMGLIDGGKKK